LLVNLNRRALGAVLLTAIALSAGAVAPSAQASPIAAAPILRASGIETFDFLNTTYDTNALGWEEGVVTVTDGRFQRGDCSVGDCFYFQVSPPVLGDFNGDGVSEAAVPTLVNTGGTGQFTDVAVFTFNAATSTPTLAATAGIGDRAFDGIYKVIAGNKRLIIERFTNPQGACCATAIEHGEFTLKSTGLSQLGKRTKRAFVYLGSVDEIKFLRRTSSATIAGDGLDGASIKIGARKNQRLTITMDPAQPGSLAATLTVTRNGTVLGAVSSGGTITIKLPRTAKYTLTASAVGTVTPESYASLDALITIK
jgi:hypothetical protein